MLSHCPACGQRLTCPRCGSTLRSAEGETARLECTSCHLDLGEAVTLPQNTIETVDAILTQVKGAGHGIDLPVERSMTEGYKRFRGPF